MGSEMFRGQGITEDSNTRFVLRPTTVQHRRCSTVCAHAETTSCGGVEGSQCDVVQKRTPNHDTCDVDAERCAANSYDTPSRL
jgi:hypothetical protein